MGFLGSFGRALGAPLRALPGGKTLAKPLNKSPLGKRINNKLGMNQPSKERPASPIGPSPQIAQQAAIKPPDGGKMGVSPAQLPVMQAPDVQESIQAAPAPPQESIQAAPMDKLREMLARNGGGFTGGMMNKGMIQEMGQEPAQYKPIGPRWKMY